MNEHLPRATTLLPETHFERPVAPPVNPYSLARIEPAPPARIENSSDAIAAEIQRDLPVLVRIIFRLIAGVIVASGAGLIIHTVLIAFK